MALTSATQSSSSHLLFNTFIRQHADSPFSTHGSHLRPAMPHLRIPSPSVLIHMLQNFIVSPLSVTVSSAPRSAQLLPERLLSKTIPHLRRAILRVQCSSSAHCSKQLRPAHLPWPPPRHQTCPLSSPTSAHTPRHAAHMHTATLPSLVYRLCIAPPRNRTHAQSTPGHELQQSFPQSRRNLPRSSPYELVQHSQHTLRPTGPSWVACARALPCEIIQHSSGSHKPHLNASFT